MPLQAKVRPSCKRLNAGDEPHVCGIDPYSHRAIGVGATDNCTTTKFPSRACCGQSITRCGIFVAMLNAVRTWYIKKIKQHKTGYSTSSPKHEIIIEHYAIIKLRMTVDGNRNPVLVIIAPRDSF